MIIKANVKYIERVKVPCPDDGVHIAGKDGAIKGVHALYFDDKLVFKGSNGFFWETSETSGIKVYFSFGWLGCAKKQFVVEEERNLYKLFKIGLAAHPSHRMEIDLDLRYKDKHIKKRAFGVLTQKVNYHREALEQYAKGYPYNWGAVDEDWHSPEGFLAFRNEAKKKIKKAGIKFLGSLKLGDILPDIIEKRWYIVDAGR